MQRFSAALRGVTQPRVLISTFSSSLDPEARVSLYDLMGIELRLRELFGRKVDVVSRGGLRPSLDDSILEDAVSAF